MKIIMPMARLATVRVTHVLGEPISGIIASASTTGSSSGIKSRLACGSGSAAAKEVVESVIGAPRG